MTLAFPFPLVKMHFLCLLELLMDISRNFIISIIFTTSLLDYESLPYNPDSDLDFYHDSELDSSAS